LIHVASLYGSLPLLLLQVSCYRITIVHFTLCGK